MLIADLPEYRAQDSTMAFRQSMLPRNMTRCHISIDAELNALVVEVPRELSSLINTQVSRATVVPNLSLNHLPSHMPRLPVLDQDGHVPARACIDHAQGNPGIMIGALQVFEVRQTVSLNPNGRSVEVDV